MPLMGEGLSEVALVLCVIHLCHGERTPEVPWELPVLLRRGKALCYREPGQQRAGGFAAQHRAAGMNRSQWPDSGSSDLPASPQVSSPRASLWPEFSLCCYGQPWFFQRSPFPWMQRAVRVRRVAGRMNNTEAGLIRLTSRAEWWQPPWNEAVFWGSLPCPALRLGPAGRFVHRGAGSKHKRTCCLVQRPHSGRFSTSV